MIHSAWDWDRLLYHHYVSPEKASLGGWKPMSGLGLDRRASMDTARVGVDIEDALPALPAAARYVGSSPRAVGQIVRGARLPARLKLLKQAPSVEGLSGGLGGLGVDLPSIDAADAVGYARKLEGAVGATTMATFIAGLVIGMQVQKAKTLFWAAAGIATLMAGISAGQISTGRLTEQLPKVK